MLEWSYIVKLWIEVMKKNYELELWSGVVKWIVGVE